MDDTGFAAVAAAILLIARFFIAVVFLRAGLAKLASRGLFRLAIANYDLVPARLTGATAVAVPAAEVGAGLLLLLGVLPGITAAVLAALLACFCLAIAVNLARGRVFDCGCGPTGAAPQTISWRHVGVNLVLAGFAVAICVAPPGGLELLPGPGGSFAIGIPAGAALPVVLAAALSLLLARVLSAAVAVRRQVKAPAS